MQTWYTDFETDSTVGGHLKARHSRAPSPRVWPETLGVMHRQLKFFGLQTLVGKLSEMKDWRQSYAQTGTYWVRYGDKDGVEIGPAQASGIGMEIRSCQSKRAIAML